MDSIKQNIVESKDYPYYLLIPSTVFYNKKLSSIQKLLLIEIFYQTDQGKYICELTNKRFADIFGVSEVTVSKSLGILGNLGFIVITYGFEKRKIEIERKIYE